MRPQTPQLQAQMQAERVVEIEHDAVRDDSQPVAHPLHGDRADLLGLRLGVAIEPVSAAGSRTWNG